MPLCGTPKPQALVLGVAQGEIAQVPSLMEKFNFSISLILCSPEFIFPNHSFLFPLYHALPEKEAHLENRFIAKERTELV